MLSVGDKVLVHSLKGRADLNGAVVTLKEWVEDKGRWSLVVTGHCEGTAPVSKWFTPSNQTTFF